MAASEWEQVAHARKRRRLRIVARHVIRRPALIAGLVGLLVLFNLMKDRFPMAYGLAAPAGTMLIMASMASMGRYRTQAEEPAREDASLAADTDGKWNRKPRSAARHCRVLRRLLETIPRHSALSAAVVALASVAR
ncbi:hypothetical protein [Streptomyces hirsutus]|uniref:hypothetical protein n=1 Tax=Streptomyces hirsutus TaxID=35620 RepID=UPI00369847AD